MGSLPRSVSENLHFLCAELDGQLTSLEAYFDDPQPARAQKVILRAGYSYNLWSRVQRGCQDAIKGKKTRRDTQLLMHNCALVAQNLDLIARMARRCLQHAEEVTRPELLRPAAYPKTIKILRKQIKDIIPAIEARDSERAVKMGQVKTDLDALYDQLFRTLTRDMRKLKQTEDLSNSLLAANEVRRMGEAIQSISEAILSVSIGQSVHFDRYSTLKNILSDADGDHEDVALEPLAETRSGSAISAIRSKSGARDQIDAVFKDGELEKVKEERAGVKSWEAIYPGLAPKILSYKKNGQSAALLIEYLQGQTFEHVLLNEDDETLARAQTALSRTLRDVWKRTRHDGPAEMASMKQLRARLDGVHRVHPEFRTKSMHIGSLQRPSFESLVKQAETRENALPAPFSVHIHGDFNLDNVIYDSNDRRIHFIDLHRSRYMDYVQDVSVFMVSNYRLQIQDTDIRRRVTTVASDFHKMAANFAKSQGDRGFEYRLALGLARSFASSTRFVLDKAHARRMMIRARYLLEQALHCPQGKEARLKLPIKELFSD